MKLKIKVTKDILKKSAMCPKNPLNRGLNRFYITENCAIALAIRDVFPKARVYGGVGATLNYFGNHYNTGYETRLPSRVLDFVFRFDTMDQKDRLNLPEIEFEIDIPDEVVEQINIDEIKPLLQNHPTLELV